MGLQKFKTNIKIQDRETGELYPVFKLNMSLLEAFELLEVNDLIDFYHKLDEVINFSCPWYILKTPEDFRMESKLMNYFDDEGNYIGPEGKELLYRNLANGLMNMINP